MPAVKISQLPAGTAAAGPELLPAVQDGATVALTVDQIRAGLASAAHGHGIADVNGLQGALDAKAGADFANVSNAQFAAKATAAGVGSGVGLAATAPMALGTAAVGVATTAARADHVHALPTLATLGAAAASHGHAVGDVSGLQAALDAKLAQGKHTIWIPAGAMTPRLSAGPSPGMGETASNKVMRRTLDFDAAVQEHAQFAVAMPRSWNEGSLSFQALWTATSGSGSVVWGLQAVAAGDADGLDAGFGGVVQVVDALGSAGALHITAESGAVTVAGSPAEGDLVILQLVRAATDGADTLAVDALLLGIRLYHSISAGNDA